MSASLNAPIPIRAKTPEELARKILKIQSDAGGKVSILTIYFADGEHIAWYYPLKFLGGI